MSFGNMRHYGNEVFSSTLTFSSKNTSTNTSTNQDQYYYQKPIPPERSLMESHYDQKQKSVRSISLSKKSTSNYHKPSYKQHYPDDISHDSSYLTENNKNPYEQIEEILKSQNSNLKERNELLFREVNRLRTSNKKYKELCRQQKVQLQMTRAECSAQKQKASEYKELLESRLEMMEDKYLQGNESKLCDSLLQALELSDQQ